MNDLIRFVEEQIENQELILRASIDKNPKYDFSVGVLSGSLDAYKTILTMLQKKD